MFNLNRNFKNCSFFRNARQGCGMANASGRGMNAGQGRGMANASGRGMNAGQGRGMANTVGSCKRFQQKILMNGRV